MGPSEAPVTLTPERLTAAGFAAFGQVIEASGDYRLINDGNCRRYDDLARLELGAAAGRACLSIFRARGQTLPLRIRLLERHPLSSQAFVPLNAARLLVVVAVAGEEVAAAGVRAFLAGPGQGVNYDPGVWHHPLLALGADADFLVVDRAGPGANCDEFVFPTDVAITVSDGSLP